MITLYKNRKQGNNDHRIQAEFGLQTEDRVIGWLGDL